MLVLENQGQRPPEQNNGIFVLPLSWRHAVNYAAAERKKGPRVEVDIQGFSESEAVNYARQKGFSRVVIVGADGVRSIPMSTNEGAV